MQPRIPDVQKGIVADDDFAVRALVQALLQQAGYETRCAATAREALELARLHDGALDFLVTDYQLGPSDGLELAAEIRRMYPGIPILLMSGRSMPAGVPGLIDGFLSKPFTGAALCMKLGQLLAASGTAAGRGGI